MNPTRWVVLIVTLHVVLAAGYARVTPYRAAGAVVSQRAYAQDIGAPDERQHANYVARLVDGEGLPTFDPLDPHLYESYQSHQPPLFYCVAAGYCRLTGITDPKSQGSGFGLRLLNALIGGAGVLGVWFLAMWGLKSESVALGAAAIAGLLPMNLALSGAVSNDPLLICLCTWCLAMCARAVRDGWSVGAAVTTGILTGLALLTKTTAVALIPVVGLAFVLRAPDQVAKIGKDKGSNVGERLRAIPWSKAAIALGIAFALALPWWIRNQTLYGDPLAIKAFNEAFKGSMQASEMTQIVGGPFNYWVVWVGWKSLCALFGVFGYWDVWLPAAIYWVAAALSAVACVGFGMAVRERSTRAVHVLNGVFLLLVVAAFIRFNMQYFQAQGRYLLPALGPIAVGLAAGVARLSGKALPVVVASAAVALVGVNAFVLRSLPDEFGFRMSVTRDMLRH